MPEAYRVAFTASGGKINQCPWNRGCGGNRYCSSPHHCVVQFTHRQRAYIEIDIGRGDYLAAGSDVVRRWRNESHFGSVLSIGGLFQVID